MLKNHPWLQVEGVYSHFAWVENRDFTERQYQRFLRFVKIAKTYFPNVLCHLCNTGGILSSPRYHFDMVRLGLGLYGYLPCQTNHALRLKPCKFVDATVILKKKVKKGEKIGYDASYTAPRDMTIGILDVGYGDGFLRQMSNGGKILTKHGEVAVVGKVCMDLTMVDLTAKKVSVGSKVNLLGENFKNYCITNDNFQNSRIIIYELLCILKQTR